MQIEMIVWASPTRDRPFNRPKFGRAELRTSVLRIHAFQKYCIVLSLGHRFIHRQRKQDCPISNYREPKGVEGLIMRSRKRREEIVAEEETKEMRE